METKTKILIIEDDITMRDILVHKFFQRGFDVKEADNGEKGKQVFQLFMPDIVLLDIMMPQASGFDTLRFIRDLPKGQNTPVIILSNVWSNTERRKAKDLKANGYLVKAYYTTEDIASLVDDVLEGKNIDF